MSDSTEIMPLASGDVATQVSAQIERLQNIKSAIRTKLVSLGLAENDDTLEELQQIIDDIANNGAVSGTITEKTQQYAVPKGYHNGNGHVAISQIEQNKIIADNIKSGVTILGVVGSYAGEGVDLQSKTVTPTESQQVVQADSGYDGLSSVTVNRIPTSYAVITGVTAKQADVLATKVFVDNTGTQRTGTMLNNGTISEEIDGLTEDTYTLSAGYYAGGTVSLTNDIANALAAL